MIQIRPFESEDLNFVQNSWISSLRKYFLDAHEGMSHEQYFTYQRKICDMLMQRAHCRVACNIEFPTQIFGYIIEEILPHMNVIHFAYTKQSYRRSGILKKFLEAHSKSNPTFYTHKSGLSRLIAPKINAKFDPVLINIELTKEKHEADQVR